MIKTFHFIFGFLLVFMFSYCSKKQITEVDSESQSVVDYAVADQEFMSIIPAIYQSALVTKGIGEQSSSAPASCDTLTFVSGDTTDFIPNTIYSLNVSSTACSRVMPDGKTRSGNINVRLTGKIRTKDTQMICKLVNYQASGIVYTCDSLVITTISSRFNQATFQVSLVNGICKTPTTATIKYKFNRTFTVYPNGNTFGESGVAYIYGEASGTNRQGTNFSTNVAQSSPLIKHKGCAYIDSGTMELTPEGFKTRKIDFGDGTCDDEATFTVKENTVAFKLK